MTREEKENNMENKITLHEWLQTTYLTSDCCIDIVEVYANGSCYHRLKTGEPALKDTPDFRFAKRFSTVTYNELQPYLDSVYESSYIYTLFELVIIEIKVKAKETEL